LRVDTRAYRAMRRIGLFSEKTGVIFLVLAIAPPSVGAIG
jgi:hypothetical protein